jgi:predicted sulfurtransferase
VVPRRKTTKMLPRRERRSGKERTRRQQPLHISARIQTTIVTIVISMVTSKDKCWKLHPKLNPKNWKKDAKKKNMLVMDLGNQIERNFDCR